MESQKTLMSSKKMDWGTPQELFDQLDNIFDFNLDACASKENTKRKCFIGENLNSLDTNWREHLFEYNTIHGIIGNAHLKAWLNPPYGRALPLWLNKVKEEAKTGSMVAVLIPARTETKWFNVIWEHADHVLFFNKRIKFEGATSGAPFPSALGIFNKGLSKLEKIELSKLGKVVDL